MSRGRLAAIGALVIAAAFGGGYLAGNIGDDPASPTLAGSDPPTTGSPSPSPSPSPSLPPDPERPFTLDLPPGWTQRDCREEDRDRFASTYCFGDPGILLTVGIDPRGGDFSSDVVWRVRVEGNRVRVAEREPECEEGGSHCSKGDGRYDLHVLHEEGGCAEVGDHVYCFHFRNDDAESLPFDTVTAILESFLAA